MTASRLKRGSGEGAGEAPSRPLSAREREVLGRLADGLSGAQIARELVLSPETVRTHVRNAMEKLGAATRSQAVVMAMESGQIGDGPAASRTSATSAGGGSAPLKRTPGRSASGPVLTALLSGVAGIADIESGAIYLAEEGGMLLRLAARSAEGQEQLQSKLTIGQPGLGRVALERRAQLIPSPTSGDSAQRGPLLAAPMTAQNRLVGILALGVRQSRPTSRRELLLVEAFATRIAEIIASGSEPATLSVALKRFRASWTGALEL